MIYLIQSSEYLKIGYTSNMEQRKNAYNTHNPNCQFLAVIDGDRSVEQELHRKFQKYRYSREWFYFNTEILDEFNVGDNTDEDSNNIVVNNDCSLDHDERIDDWIMHFSEYVNDIDVTDIDAIKKINWLMTMYICIVEFLETHNNYIYERYKNILYKKYNVLLNKWKYHHVNS